MTIEAITLYLSIAVAAVCLFLPMSRARLRYVGAYLCMTAYLAIAWLSLGWPTPAHLPDRFTLWAYTPQGIVIEYGHGQRFFSGHFPPELKKMLEQSGGALSFGHGAAENSLGVPLELEGKKYEAVPLLGENKLEPPRDLGPSYTPPVNPGGRGHPGGF